MKNLNVLHGFFGHSFILIVLDSLQKMVVFIEHLLNVKRGRAGRWSPSSCKCDRHFTGLLEDPIRMTKYSVFYENYNRSGLAAQASHD